jgi:hypothetical protein
LAGIGCDNIIGAEGAVIRPIINHFWGEQYLVSKGGMEPCR